MIAVRAVASGSDCAQYQWAVQHIQTVCIRDMMSVIQLRFRAVFHADCAYRRRYR